MPRHLKADAGALACWAAWLAFLFQAFLPSLRSGEPIRHIPNDEIEPAWWRGWWRPARRAAGDPLRRAQVCVAWSDGGEIRVGRDGFGDGWRAEVED